MTDFGTAAIDVSLRTRVLFARASYLLEDDAGLRDEAHGSFVSYSWKFFSDDAPVT